MRDAETAILLYEGTLEMYIVHINHNKEGKFSPGPLTELGVS